MYFLSHPNSHAPLNSTHVPRLKKKSAAYVNERSEMGIGNCRVQSPGNIVVVWGLWVLLGRAGEVEKAKTRF